MSGATFERVVSQSGLHCCFKRYDCSCGLSFMRHTPFRELLVNRFELRPHQLGRCAKSGKRTKPLDLRAFSSPGQEETCSSCRRRAMYPQCTVAVKPDGGST